MSLSARLLTAAGLVTALLAGTPTARPAADNTTTGLLLATAGGFRAEAPPPVKAPVAPASSSFADLLQAIGFRRRRETSLFGGGRGWAGPGKRRYNRRAHRAAFNNWK